MKEKEEEVKQESGREEEGRKRGKDLSWW